MPQLDISTYTSQLFWLIISFASLYMFTARVTMPRMTKILEARALRIEGSIQRADELKAQAEKLKHEFEATLNATRNRAHENVMQMIHKVTVTSAQRKKDLNHMMMERIQSSEAHIARQKSHAMGEIKTVAESAALLMAEKLMDQKIDPKSIKDVLNDLFNKQVA